MKSIVWLLFVGTVGLSAALVYAIDGYIIQPEDEQLIARTFGGT